MLDSDVFEDRCGCAVADGSTGVGDCGLVRFEAGDRASGLVACRKGDLAGRVGDCVGLSAAPRATVERVIGDPSSNTCPEVARCGDNAGLLACASRLGVGADVELFWFSSTRPLPFGVERLEPAEGLLLVALIGEGETAFIVLGCSGELLDCWNSSRAWFNQYRKATLRRV